MSAFDTASPMSSKRTDRIKGPRRFPIGAEVVEGGVDFRVWAPASKRVSVQLSEEVSMSAVQEFELESEPDGYHSRLVPAAEAGMHYRYRLASGAFPDPASRFQPQGPHGPSRIIDARRFRWADQTWRGVPRRGQIIYELHIGTFTPEGTFATATAKLEHLRDLGVTLVEVMPVSDFPGRFGWGYDGVNLYAPTRLYGEPDDFRRFVDRAHALGVGVILDVVYNHFGPDGNYAGQFAPQYFSKRYHNEWNDPLNFDDEQSAPVREFFIENAAYWIDEFHLDGLRLDATQQIFDRSEDHLVAAVTRRAREAAAGRGIYVASENEKQETRHVRPLERGGCGVDALWNDDFHHAAIVALTGRREAYCCDYQGSPQEFLSAAKWGFLYQGQWCSFRKQFRGSPALDTQPDNFVAFLQNHDQIANTMWGQRVHKLTSPGRFRAMTAWLLLGPETPMLFQGQEFATSKPFLYFADHGPELAKAVRAGRLEFRKLFSSATGPMADPESEETFRACLLDWEETSKNEWALRLHRDLIALRQTDALIGKAVRGSYDGAALSQSAFLLRYFGADDDRLLVVNLGDAFNCDSTPEPLLAPPEGCSWKLIWFSEEVAYQGSGVAPIEEGGRWTIPAEAAAFLVAEQGMPLSSG
jgi:maltooligosyltrehalose trehalohydrolase